MGIVIADTSPLNYLILIDLITILPQLFQTVHVPEEVREELGDSGAPVIVRDWISSPPAWLSINSTSHSITSSPGLDKGELAALALANELKAELLLIDDREATMVIRACGFQVMGTLGVLSLAATNGLIDLEDAFMRLTETNFRCPPDVMKKILAEQRVNRT